MVEIVCGNLCTSSNVVSLEMLVFAAVIGSCLATSTAHCLAIESE